MSSKSTLLMTIAGVNGYIFDKPSYGFNTVSMKLCLTDILRNTYATNNKNGVMTDAHEIERCYEIKEIYYKLTYKM